MTDSTEVAAKLYKIAERLLAQTYLGNIKWDVTEDDEKFLHSAASSAISIDTSARLNPQPYWFSVYNSAGTLIGQLTAHDPPAVEDPWGQEAAESLQSTKLMKDLWNEARNDALEISATLDTVLDELMQKPPF